jgi:hypothetical protein
MTCEISARRESQNNNLPVCGLFRFRMNLIPLAIARRAFFELPGKANPRGHTQDAQEKPRRPSPGSLMAGRRMSIPTTALNRLISNPSTQPTAIPR